LTPARWRGPALLLLGVAALFAALFWWFDRFSTGRATEQLRDDLNAVALGTAAGVDVEEVTALYREGQPNAAGFSDDPRYVRVLDWFDTVHRLRPQAWPYLFVRGNEPDTRRIGEPKGEREFVYLADLNARYTPARSAQFLEPDRGSDAGLGAWTSGTLRERPGVYTDRWGSWMTTYAPVVDAAGTVRAIVGVDVEASYVRAVQERVRRQMLAIFVPAYLLLVLIGFYMRRVRRLRGLFGRYASQTLLREPALLELGYASRRQVTVLFADIDKFSTLSEQYTPDEVIRMLNDYFEAMAAIIVPSGGWIKQFVGDEIMVIYGAPDDHPRAAPAAVDTAVRMIARLAELRAAATRPGFFEITVGIHTGEVTVGTVGNKDRTEYAAVGDHVNLGSRIMGLGKSLGTPILVSSAVREAAGALPGVAFTDRGAHPVKGRQANVQVFEVGARP
jgi:class 3 adenylate cyclase